MKIIFKTSFCRNIEHKNTTKFMLKKNNYRGMNYDVIAEDLLNKSKLKVFKSLMILILLSSKTNFLQIIFCLIDEDMTKNYCSRCHRL